MTPQQINIVIAESVGWIFHSSGDIESPEGCLVINNTNSYPNYTADLNAMHEVWCTLSEAQHKKFRTQLRLVILCAIKSFEPPKGPCHSVSNATALQRAEAYLRTIGKWNEKD